MAEEYVTPGFVPNLPPFKAWLASNIPAVYDNTMSYYDELTALIKYLEDEVIPAVNDSGEAVTQLQNLYTQFTSDMDDSFDEFTTNISSSFDDFKTEIVDLYNQLKDFVDNYFENLDVQQEINNKLDEMAGDGTLEALISTEILGDLTQLHTTDKSSIVSAVNEVNDNEVTLATTVTRLATDKVLLIGDSYLQGYDGSTNVNSWGYYFKEASGLDNNHLSILYESGAGFTKQGNAGHNFLELLQANISTFTDKNMYTDIIIGFGLNENENTVATITTAMQNFATYAKQQFPNAKIHLGMVGNLKKCLTSQNNTGRERLYLRTFMATKNAAKFGIRYLTGIEQVAHDYTLFGTDDIHLTQDGYLALGYGIYQAWKTGNYNYNSNFSGTQTITTGGDLVSPTANITAQVRITGNNRQIVVANSNITFTPFTVANAKIKLTDDGEMANNSLFRSYGVSIPVIYMQAKFTKSDDTSVIYPCNIQLDTTNGSLVMNVPSDLNGETIKGIKTLIFDIYNLPTLLS